MHNLLNSSKGQFFILTAFAIATILYFVSRWLEPATIIDTSQVILRLDTFVFDDITENANKTVWLSNSCEELKYNLEEYSNLVKIIYGKMFGLYFNYTIACNSQGATVNFNITLTSSSAKLATNFTTIKKW